MFRAVDLLRLTLSWWIRVRTHFPRPTGWATRATWAAGDAAGPVQVHPL